MSDEKVGGIYYTVEARTAALIDAQHQVDSSTSSMQKGFDKTDKSVNTLNKSFGKLSAVASSLAAALSANMVVEYASAWTELSNKLINSIKEHETLADVTGRVFKVAQESRAEIGATAELYGRLEKSTRTYNVSADELARLTTTINKSFVVSGASAEEAAGAIRQLAQGMGAGALRGDEFNTVMEAGPRLAQALADSLGVDIGQLRTMAAQGKLTTQVIVNGLLKQGDTIAAEFAKTTVTLGQSFTTATNNITKFVGESTTVQSSIAAFGSVVVTLSDNLDKLSYVFMALAGVMGSRFLGGLAAATAGMVKNTVGAAALAKAHAQEAQAAEMAANSEVRKAAADKEAAISAMNLAQAEYNVLKGTLAEAHALDNLIAKKSAVTAISADLVVAEKAQAVAMATAETATKAASVALTGLKGAMALLGGPAGIIMIAAAGLYMWYQKTQQAKEESIALADEVDKLTESYKNLNHAQLEGTQAKLEESVKNQKEALADLRDEVESTTRVMELYKKVLDHTSQNSPSYTRAQQNYEQAVRDNKIAVANLDTAQEKLTKTGGLLEQVNARLAGGLDILSQKAQQLKADIDAITKTPEESRSTKGDQYLKQMQDEIALLNIKDKRERAVAASRQKALDDGVAAGSKQLQQIEDSAGALYDRQQAERNAASATKATVKAENQAAQAEKQRQKTLQDLNNDMAVAELKARGLNREAAQLAEVQKLGPGASSDEIKKAQEQAGEMFDIKQRAADKQAALEADLTSKENKSYQDASDQLKRQLAGKIIDQDQYNKRSEELAGKHQQNLAKINAQQVVTPQQEAAGEVDPVQQLANEHAQKLALIQSYEKAGVLIHDQAVALKNEADTQYDQQRLAALEQQYRAQSELNNFTMSMIDAVGQRSGNMITGLIEGTQSLEEGMRNLAVTILDQAVGALVQMGVQAAKNAIIGESASTAAVAQAAVSGPAIAAAYAPAASMVSLASYGANAVPAQAGIASTMAMSKALSVAGGRRYGGGVSSGNLYRVNESGEPEMFQSGSRQYMMPTTGGKVVPADSVSGGGSSSPVNVIINNMANGTTVENRGYNPDTKTITLAVKEVARQLNTQTGEVTRALKGGWNVTGKSK